MHFTAAIVAATLYGCVVTEYLRGLPVEYFFQYYHQRQIKSMEGSRAYCTRPEIPQKIKFRAGRTHYYVTEMFLTSPPPCR